jgi:hypothetical protein
MRRLAALLVAVSLFVCAPAHGQGGGVPSGGGNGNQLINVGGVAITPDGLLQVRRTVATPAARLKADPSLTYISLSKLVEGLKSANTTTTPTAKDLRYLGGLTRIDYLFVYPQENGTGDLVLAGPSEPINDADKAFNPLQPLGRISGRPVLHLDDLVTAFRAVNAGNGGRNANFFGCSLDLTANAQGIAEDVGRRFANASRAQVSAALKEALGPQTVRILGVPEDSRLALAMVAADYRLKRICIGAEVIPAIGTGVSSSLATSRVWFEPAYDALAVSGDGLSYHFSGPRLKVKAGAQQFNDKSAVTPAATAFAKRFSDKMNDVAPRLDAVADLQNVADLFLVAVLIKHDKLAEKAGVDLAWLLTGPYKPTPVPVPRTAETLVADTGAAIIQGGVALPVNALASLDRTTSDKAAAARTRPTDGWFLTKAAK